MQGEMKEVTWSHWTHAPEVVSNEIVLEPRKDSLFIHHDFLNVIILHIYFVVIDNISFKKDTQGDMLTKQRLP